MADDAWELIYSRQDVTDLPWYLPKLDPDLRDFISSHRVPRGEFLDIGAGPGTQSIALSRLGFSVTAIDISPTALRKARERAGLEGMSIDFLLDDILDSRLPAHQFDYALDRGVFHSLSPEQRPALAKSVKRLLRPAGLYFLKCFSIRTPGELGPYRFSKEQVSQYFSRDFRILLAKDTVFQGTLKPEPFALFFAMQRKEK